METCTPWTVVFKSWLMSVIITFMFEPAKLAMNCANASGINIRRNAGDIIRPLDTSATTASLHHSAQPRHQSCAVRRHAQVGPPQPVRIIDVAALLDSRKDAAVSLRLETRGTRTHEGTGVGPHGRLPHVPRCAWRPGWSQLGDRTCPPEHANRKPRQGTQNPVP